MELKVFFFTFIATVHNSLWLCIVAESLKKKKNLFPARIKKHKTQQMKLMQSTTTQFDFRGSTTLQIDSNKL